MGKIFLINRVFYNSDAGYDDNTVLGYVTSEEVAKIKVSELNKLHEEVEILTKKIDEHASQVIRPSLGNIEYEVCPQYPKWGPGIHQDEITKEMRDERNRIIELQEEVSKRNNDRQCLWYDKAEKLKQEYIRSLNISPDVAKAMIAERGYDSVQCYTYEELEELV